MAAKTIEPLAQEVGRIIGNKVAKQIEAEVNQTLRLGRTDSYVLVHVDVEKILKEIFCQVDEGTFLHEA